MALQQIAHQVTIVSKTRHVPANIIQNHERGEDLLIDVFHQEGKSNGDIEALALDITHTV